MKKSTLILTRRQKRATIQKWAEWILKQRASAAKATTPRTGSERV
jgi:hypothetical protein